MSGLYRVAKQGQRDVNKLQDYCEVYWWFRLCWHTNGWRPPRLEWVTLGLSLPLGLVWEETLDEMRGGGGESRLVHTYTPATDTHSCFLPCALLMKDSLIFLSTRWLYLNCCLGFLASFPIALEFMSCTPEWLYLGPELLNLSLVENVPAIIF